MRSVSSAFRLAFCTAASCLRFTPSSRILSVFSSRHCDDLVRVLLAPCLQLLKRVWSVAAQRVELALGLGAVLLWLYDSLASDLELVLQEVLQLRIGPLVVVGFLQLHEQLQ